jgi:hypothetical protein
MNLKGFWQKFKPCRPAVIIELQLARVNRSIALVLNGLKIGSRGAGIRRNRRILIQKNRGGSLRATPSLRNYIKQRARLHTVVLFIGIFRKNFSRSVEPPSDF